MELRVVLTIVCIVSFLTGSVSAASISLADVTGVPGDEFIALPEIPPPTDGSLLQRKVLDTQPFVFKTSNRLLHEAEISRDLANRKWNEEMMLYQQQLEKGGHHYSIEFIKNSFLRSQDPAFTPGMIEALQDYEYANKMYNKALAATGDKDYEQKARIFDSAAEMYGGAGSPERQKTAENAALAARARAAAEEIPLPPLVAVAGIIGAILVLSAKRK